MLLVNRGVRFDDDENRRQNTEVFGDAFLTEVIIYQIERAEVFYWRL